VLPLSAAPPTSVHCAENRVLKVEDLPYSEIPDLEMVFLDCVQFQCDGAIEVDIAHAFPELSVVPVVY
jgi:hypothetical protein